MIGFVCLGWFTGVLCLVLLIWLVQLVNSIVNSKGEYCILLLMF